jgi:FkbM family methyltransferase
MSRILDGLRWRWWFLKRYWFLLRTFRNGPALVRAYRRGLACDRAILRDGTCLLHPPGQHGFVNTILEIWLDRTYMPGAFYHPADGDVILDIGANVGLFTIWLARQNPRCRIVALEPAQANFGMLQANLQAARTQQATAYHMALGARAAQGRMISDNTRSLDHRLVIDNSNPDLPQVRVLSLGDLLELVGAERIAFLKVDIEGSEYQVFQQIDENTMKRIDRFAIEYHDHLAPGTQALLRERLTPTHHLTFRPEGKGDYGVLLGELKT